MQTSSADKASEFTIETDDNRTTKKDPLKKGMQILRFNAPRKDKILDFFVFLGIRLDTLILRSLMATGQRTKSDAILQ